MRVDPFDVTYCTNVHPGESLEELNRALNDEVSAVKARFDANPFGAGLRLGNSVVEALTQWPDALSRLHDTCSAHGYSVFTVNGFPYGNFDSGHIKTQVYDPGWQDPERLRYTLRLAEVVAALPGPAYRTISTVAGGYGPQTNTREARDGIAAHLNEAAEGLARLADEYGVHIRLCLEPEPWTSLETTADVLGFWDQHLDGERPEIRDHLGLCYDCCHQALHFEDPTESMTALEAAGVTIGKVQVSSALHIDNPADDAACTDLMGFAEPRFLHQVVAKTSEGLLKAVDLNALDLEDMAWRSADAWRCHFHVPIWWAGAGHLGTTKGDWQAAVRAAKRLAVQPHLEIETYTWDVIPVEERRAMAGGDLTASIIAEYDALLRIISE